jgi:hypothetical protein
MALAAQVFDHNSPAVPTLAGGMRLGSAGVSGAPLQTIGVMTALSSADGSFSDTTGQGQIDYDSSGYLYVADATNQRVQRFSKAATGLYVYDSKCTALSALGSAVNLNLVAIDRARSQIHLASSAQAVASTWVGVWDLASWPTLTVANRVRSYGSNNGSGAGKTNAGMGLTLVGDSAYAVSSAGDYRTVQWDHTTGVLTAEVTDTYLRSRLASDGTRIFQGSLSGATKGLHRLDAALASALRLDNTLPSGLRYSRRNYLTLGTNGDTADIQHHGGRIYLRTISEGRIVAWGSANDTFVDEFAWPGGASASESFGHAPGQMFTNQPLWGKMGTWVSGDGSKSDDLLVWSSNAQNNVQHSFLTAFPLSTSTATWTKTDWSAGTSTLQAIALQGTGIAAEKLKVRLKKNSGSWVTVLASQLADSTQLQTVGTLTSGDTLTVELSLSTWDRLDGHATLIACRDKITPTEVAMSLYYEDSFADVYNVQLSPQVTGQQGGQAAFKGKQGA